MPEAYRLHLTHHTVIVDREEQLVRTIFVDGAEAHASPHRTADYLEHARSKGCGEDVWRYCVEHDLAHVILGELIGTPSPVLWFVAHHMPTDAPAFEAEEKAAQALHAYLNQAGWPVEYQRARQHAGIETFLSSAIA